MRKVRRMGKGLCILSALLLMFALVGCDDSDSSDRDLTNVDDPDFIVGTGADEGDLDTVNDQLVTTGDAENGATAILNTDRPFAADGTSLADRTINARLETRDADLDDENDIDLPSTAEMDAADFDANLQTYVNGFQEGQDVTWSILGEVTLEAEAADGTDVYEFQPVGRAVAGGVDARITFEDAPGVNRVPVWFWNGDRFIPVAFAIVETDANGNTYIEFQIRRTGRYIAAWPMDRLDFDFDTSIDNNCEIDVTVSEDGDGFIEMITYASSGDISTSWTTTSGSVMTLNGSHGSNQVVRVRSYILYELRNFWVPVKFNFMLDFDCLSGSITG